MKSKLGICLVIILITAVVLIIRWYPTTPAPTVSSTAIKESAPNIATASATDDAELTAPQALPVKLEQAKKATAECWQQLNSDDESDKPSLFDNQLSAALKNALASGESYEQLLRQVPASDSVASVYIRQLNMAQRQRQLQQLGFEPTQEQLQQQRNDRFYAQLTPVEQRVMLSEELAGDRFKALRDDIVKLSSTLDTPAFAEQTSSYSLNSGDLTSLMLQDRALLPEDKLLALIEQTPTNVLNQPPLVVNVISSTPFINMADYAAFSLDVPMLQALAASGVYPTDIKGYVGPIEYALSHRFMGDDDDGKTIATLQYLVEQGYKAYTVNGDGGPQLGSAVSPVRWHFVSDEVKQYLQQANALTPSNEQPPAPTGEVAIALNQLIAKQQQRAERHNNCRVLQENEFQIEQLLSGEQIRAKINALTEQYSGEALLDALQAEDPVLVDIYLDRGVSRRPEHYLQIRDALLGDDPVNQLGELLQTTELSSDDLDVILLQLRRLPELVPYWNNRQSALPPNSLSSFVMVDGDSLNAMVEQGFDLHIVDKYNRNLYSVFFDSKPELIEQLLQAHVDPFSNDYGSDALDMALDRSYLDNELFAATAEILRASVALAGHHQRRLARIKLYRPALYQRLVALDPSLAVNDEIKPSVVLSVRK